MARRDTSRERRRKDDRKRRQRSRSQSPSRDGREKKRREENSSPSPAAEAQRSVKVTDQSKSEAEKRRKRVEAWQEQRRLLEAQQQAKQAPTVEREDDQAAQTQKGSEDNAAAQQNWTLEDDVSEPSGGEDQAEREPVEVQQPSLSLRPRPRQNEEEDDVDPLTAFMAQNAAALKDDEFLAAREHNGHKTVDDDDGDDLDPLDAYMNEIQTKIPSHHSTKNKKGGVRVYDSDSSVPASQEGNASDTAEKQYDYIEDDVEWAAHLKAGKLSKGDRLALVDHSAIHYPPFRRNFYIEVPELAKMTPQQVEGLRQELDGIKTRGKDVPKPLRNWNQAGLSSRILEVLNKLGFEHPLPIQSQALPVIMSGRDCICIAKTGSGKTLAFVLPMLRHIKDQPPLSQGDGPIALIMAPTRELVAQIGREARRFSKVINLNCTCVFGGSGIANQISELKRGAEIVVCTPGRMIDILVTGKITNLKRVTYLVMDEADRMFDMGFEPQIMRIVNNIRPDRQTVMFSATFPRSVEVLARQLLVSPVEIQIGGRSVVNKDIAQFVEIRPESERFLRLLEILGEWYDKGKVLVFVSSQDRCDALFRDLLRAGYPCLSLHGGKDQSDRQSTIADFKSNVCNVLVATSVAARGLDVKELVLVVNYDPPNHIEDYVHRVGRTGRAGQKGTAITFISKDDEDQYAPDLVRAYRESGAPIPNDLQLMADGFETKRKAGVAKAHGSGFGGSGFKFDKAEEAMVKALKKQVAREFGGELSESESEMGDEGGRKDENHADEVDDDIREVVGGPTADGSMDQISTAPLPVEVQARVKAAQEVRDKLLKAAAAGGPGGQSVPGGASTAPVPALSAAQAAAQAAQALAARAVSGHIRGVGEGSVQGGAAAGAALQVPAVEQHRRFETELEINDFPQSARWRVTHRDTVRDIGHDIGAAIIVKGRYYRPGEKVPEGERKLYLHIQGKTEAVVKKAKAELRRLIEESTEKALRREAPSGPGKYSIM